MPRGRREAVSTERRAGGQRCGQGGLRPRDVWCQMQKGGLRQGRLAAKSDGQTQVLPRGPGLLEVITANGS